jgi:hypothetical protein
MLSLHVFGQDYPMRAHQRGKTVVSFGIILFRVLL